MIPTGTTEDWTDTKRMIGQLWPAMTWTPAQGDAWTNQLRPRRQRIVQAALRRYYAEKSSSKPRLPDLLKFVRELERSRSDIGPDQAQARPVDLPPRDRMVADLKGMSSERVDYWRVVVRTFPGVWTATHRDSCPAEWPDVAVEYAWTRTRADREAEASRPAPRRLKSTPAPSPPPLTVADLTNALTGVRRAG